MYTLKSLENAKRLQSSVNNKNRDKKFFKALPQNRTLSNKIRKEERKKKKKK